MIDIDTNGVIATVAKDKPTALQKAINIINKSGTAFIKAKPETLYDFENNIQPSICGWDIYFINANSSSLFIQN